MQPSNTTQLFLEAPGAPVPRSSPLSHPRQGISSARPTSPSSSPAGGRGLGGEGVGLVGKRGRHDQCSSSPVKTGEGAVGGKEALLGTP